MNRVLELQKFGQSVWLDAMRRSLVTGGELARLVEEDGVRGVTSNPSLFEKAIAGSGDYAEELRALAPGAASAKDLYEAIAVRDVQLAADVLRPVHEETGGRDGFVSLEVSPALARDAAGTVEEARRLWRALGRENVMVKVPATPEGVRAVETLVAEGVNVNVTLLFSVATYDAIARAYLAGLRARAAKGQDLRSVASVASFFVSRVDTAVDARVEAALAGAAPARRAELARLLGKVAVANAKLGYRRYQEIFSGPEWEALAGKGARTQRVLWASTGTKNPAYSDVLYAEELVGPDTVDTMPPATLDAFRDHGRARRSLEEGIEEARETLAALGRAGISLEEVTTRLLDDGVRLFAEAFDKLLVAVEKVRAAGARRRIDAQRAALPGTLAHAVQEATKEWQEGRKTRRLWARDGTLWTGKDEGRWLGWLGVTEGRLAHLEPLRRLAAEVRERGYENAVLLGMGGSSLCPEVMSETFGRQGGFPALHVLDSTDPAQVRAVERAVDLARTLFLVASKSGSTLEPNLFLAYFFGRVKETLGAEEAGRRFVAITDPGSSLERTALDRGFAHVFHGVPSIGGRYSALSNFGVVPSAVMGLDVARLLDRTEEMVQACAACVPVAENPGAQLGLALGEAARRGRDKLTLVASPRLRDLGAWIEQLVAESTGKQGKAILPVDGEPLGPPDVYGDDRVFVSIALDGDAAPGTDAALDALEAAGHPVIRIAVKDTYDIGQEFFRWEIATAVAGAVLGIHPFDQPDVEASKVETRKLTAEVERTGAFPAEMPFWEGEGVRLFAAARDAQLLRRAAGPSPALADVLRAQLGRLRRGDYFALLAYLERSEQNRAPLEATRVAVRDRRRVATCLGFGPRFLHSTGQAYKGGPDSGVFLQVTCDDAADLPIPDQRLTFGVVKAAQARGDLQVLEERGRRALRVHLGADVARGLAALRAAVERALS